MPRGSSTAVRGGEYIHHITSVRLRVVGNGNLRMTLYGLDDVKSFPCSALAMSTAPGREPTKLANFRNQRTSLEIKTTVINEYFKISRIILFAKQSATSYPG